MFRYLAFNKPFNVLSSFTDQAGRKTLQEYVSIPGVYAAGRLDYDSEGLLLLTDDGGLVHRLTQPAFHLAKTYLAQVEGEVTADAMARLAGGVVVQGKITRRCEVMAVAAPEVAARNPPVTPHGPTAWLRIVLTEGRKRQVRHMTAAVGLPTLRLLRIAIGPVYLGALRPGEWRYLDPAEVARLP